LRRKPPQLNNFLTRSNHVNNFNAYKDTSPQTPVFDLGRACRKVVHFKKFANQLSNTLSRPINLGTMGI
jgi:hypothetical protein